MDLSAKSISNGEDSVNKLERLNRLTLEFDSR